MRPTVAILAGGLATRLHPITERIPKSLLDVAGKPFARHQIEMLRRNGLTEIVFLVGHLGEMIREALGDGRELGVRIGYAFDGPRQLGTGGAIRQALPMLGETFFVLYGDSYLDCDYGAIERAFYASGRSGLMTVFHNEGRFDTSNIEFVNGEIRRYEKVARTDDMHHIDYGAGMLRASALQVVPDTCESFDLSQVYQTLLAQGDLAGFEVPDRFYEIGSPVGLSETRALLAGHGD